jgi:hypothetical protein
MSSSEIDNLARVRPCARRTWSVPDIAVDAFFCSRSTRSSKRSVSSAQRSYSPRTNDAVDRSNSSGFSGARLLSNASISSIPARADLTSCAATFAERSELWSAARRTSSIGSATILSDPSYYITIPHCGIHNMPPCPTVSLTERFNSPTKVICQPQEPHVLPTAIHPS